MGTSQNEARPFRPPKRYLKKRVRLILRHSHMGGIYWDVLGETGVYSQQCQYQKTYSLAAFVFS